MSSEFVCGLCNSEDGKLIYEQQALSLDYQLYNKHLGSIQISYYVCLTCGTVSQFPLPHQEELDDYYSAGQTTQTHQDTLEYKLPVYKDRIKLLQ